MKKEEIKKQDELNDEQLDNVAGAKEKDRPQQIAQIF